MGEKTYSMRELVRAKAKAEKIEMDIIGMLQRFDGVPPVSIPLHAASTAMKAVQDGIQKLPGRYRP